MAIGLLPDQSINGIPVDRYVVLSIAFGKKVADNLKLKALLENYEGKIEEAFLALTALHGWADHYGNIEAPTLLYSTLAVAIRLNTQSAIHSVILPHLLEKNIDYHQWSKLVVHNYDLNKELTHMWRGEWYSFITGRWSMKSILEINPRDPIALLTVYTALLDDFKDSKILSAPGYPKLNTPDHLTRKSRAILDMVYLGIPSYNKGYLRAQAALRQYEIAFMLRRLESEGQDLKLLDQQTIKLLPLQMLPGIELSIDFDKRVINAPIEIPNTKPVTF